MGLNLAKLRIINSKKYFFQRFLVVIVRYFILIFLIKEIKFYLYYSSGIH